MSLFKKHSSSKTSPAAVPSAKAKRRQSSQQVVPAKAKLAAKDKFALNKELVKGQLSYRILVHPLMTEKINLQNALNQYSFIVSRQATKIEIKRAILETYKVNPLKVRTINMRGKAVSSGRGRSVHRKSWKKAIVTLPAGKKIDIYEGV